jgi:hypothetical protein
MSPETTPLAGTTLETPEITEPAGSPGLEGPEPAALAPAPPARSRRSLLTAALAGLAGLVGGRLGSPDPAAAAVGSPLILGSEANNSGTANTQVLANSNAATFKLLQYGPGTGLFGYALPTSGATRGVYGRVDSPNGDGIQARNAGVAGTGAALRAFGGQNDGIVATTDNFARAAIHGANNGYGQVGCIGILGEASGPSGMAVYGTATYCGVFGNSTDGIGVSGQSSTGDGVSGTSSSGYGVSGTSSSSAAVYASSGGATKTSPALRANNTNTSNGMAAYLTNSSAFATAHFQNGGSGQVLWLVNGGTDAAGTGGGDFINARNNAETDTQFRVATDGSAYSDGAFNGGGADFAELLPATGRTEPADVLEIGPDGRLRASTGARSASVAGVHSTRPGFIGGAAVSGERPAGQVALAIVGVVPVKASAENGPIVPGDRLVSAAVRGHAMRADATPELGTVIGKALEPLAAGRGTISMLVMLQ